MLITVNRYACLCPTRHYSRDKEKVNGQVIAAVKGTLELTAPTYRSSNGYMACISAGDNAAKRWVGIDGNVAANSTTDIVGTGWSGAVVRVSTGEAVVALRSYSLVLR